MRGRKPEKFKLKAKDRAILQELLRDGQTPLRVARRAQILLRRADQHRQVGALSENVERNAATIWRVCQRYVQGGVETALYDAARSGRPPVFSQGTTQADLLMLRKAVGEARSLAVIETDETIKADVFSASLDSTLIGIVNKIRQKMASVAIREKLKTTFGNLWENISVDSRDFLVTAEVVKDDLLNWAETEPSIDFTPAVQMYSVALEKEVLDKIFIAFRDSPFAQKLPDLTGQNSLDKSLEATRNFVDKKRHLALGDMAFCLLNVGCKLRNAENNGFVQFLREIFIDFDNFCDEKGIPGRVIKYSQDYRNRAAHVSRLSRDECLEARAFLLDEPIRLMLSLAEAYKPLKP